MPVDPQLRNLDIEIPTQPEVLVKLSLLMAAEDIDLQASRLDHARDLCKHERT